MPIRRCLLLLVVLGSCGPQTKNARTSMTGLSGTNGGAEQGRRALGCNDAVALNPGFEKDRAALALTYGLAHKPFGSPPRVTTHSSGEAGAAAHRIFRGVRLVGASRARVLELLDSVAPEVSADGALRYRFDNGFDGTLYT